MEGAMRRVSISDFRKCEGAFAEAAQLSPDLSPFCSGPVWQWAAHDSLHEGKETAEHFIYEADGNWIAFVEWDDYGLWFPFEGAWMFACPLVGDPHRCIELLETAVRENPAMQKGFCIGGVLDGGELHRAFREKREEFLSYREVPMSEAMIIELGAGSDAWLSRRSRKFRRTLRQATEVEGIEIVDLREEKVEDLFERMLGIQEKTYKWSEGTDIFQSGNYERFYLDIMRRLSKSGDLRFLVARQGEEDIAYIFGGTLGKTYRGFQMSYAESARDLGVGNRLQWENLVRCEQEGVERYDLGMHADYKERWIDRRDDYLAIVVAFP
ncbi:MAG: hypothetical protein CMO55_20970 [Verrucomicrobiales bacterium]|nr:hypothetical protein [Verrucomicrobiales bacterium]